MEEKALSLPTKIWQKAVLRSEANLKEAIECLNRSSLQIVLVVDAKRNLIGTLTDGDIRRGLLKGVSFGEPINKLVNKNPIVTKKTRKDLGLVEMMQKLKIFQIPVVDKRNRLVGLHLWDEKEVNSKKPNLVIIMAGGFGKRLGSLTKKTPKPLLPIRGKPMLSLILEKIQSEGFVNVIVSVFFQKEKIKKYFRDGSRFGLNIKYLEEKAPLGTAGSLSLLPLQKYPILVLNADIICNFSLAEFLSYHKKQKAVASVAVKPDTYEFSFGIVKTKGTQILGFQEKPLFSFLYNAGVYCLNPTALNRMPKNKYLDMPDFLMTLVRNKEKVVAYPLHEHWQDLGTLYSYSQAND